MVLTKNASTKQSEAKTTISSSAQSNDKKKAKAKAKLTRVVIHCDVGFNNSIFIRGSGANLS